MLHGGDYNPDQWVKTPEIWDEDMRLMKLVHGNEMTMGIFAWSEIEPEEGVFNFSVFDTMMDKIYENGGRVIFATPSGARPKWLA
ncbi:MAG: beta-galactosidase, partial [Clostridia bacterium]|nr:beta-galactosidase [Clostridia bacterium]